jgi:hypothetical protein
MRTAVVRVNVDPAGTLTPDATRAGTAQLAVAAASVGITIVGMRPDSTPPAGRELQLLAEGDDPAALLLAVGELCRRAYGTEPATGVVTYLSRGTDEDALGVLAGFGLSGRVERVPGGNGWDVVTVRLARSALDRIPESRIQTALEASLNCEVRIVAG